MQALSLTPDTHGSVVAVSGTGVLICGAPGSGKSTLALGLIDRGHALLADDLVFLTIQQNRVCARRPSSAPLMAQRDIGLFTPRRTVNCDAIPIDLLIWLDDGFRQTQPVDASSQRRYAGQTIAVNFADRTLPGYALPAKSDLLTNCLLLEQLVHRLKADRCE